jgi:branched-chain amino acid aminotransferase
VISPVGPYFPTGFKPVKMLCNTSYVRASPGGMGEFKVGGNYGPTIKSLKEIQQ